MAEQSDETNGSHTSRSWSVLRRDVILERPPFLQISVERVRLPNGRTVDEYHQITLPETAVILAVDDIGDLVAFREYRHGVRQVCYTLPGGALEPGEAAVEAARREFLEETGLFAAHWRLLAVARPNANYGCGCEHYFLATGLSRVQNPKSGDLEDAEAVRLSREDVEGLIDQGEAAVTGVLAGLLLYLRVTPLPSARSADAGSAKEDKSA